jgi:DedD protein
VDEGLKRRLVGATVLVSLVVIFVPMLLQNEPVLEQGITSSNIPPLPTREFQSRVIPQPADPLPLPEKRRVRLDSANPDTAARRSPPPTATPAERKKPEPPASKRATPQVGVSAWMIQVGSFSQRQNAEKLQQQLRGKKFPVDIELASVKGRTMYRVLVGPEIDRKRTERMLARLNQEVAPLKLSGKIRRYP